MVDTLINIIPISKEAGYRRLRGEIQFTLAEAARISEKLSVSIDQLVGIDKKGKHMFHIKQLFTDDPFEKYYDLLKSSLLIYKQMKEDPDAYFYFAGGSLPNIFYFKYPLLSRYTFFRWFYQTSYIHGIAKRFEDVVIPQKIQDIQKEISEASLFVNNDFIIGENIVLSLINDLKYFATIALVKPEDVAELIKEIHMMLDDMEKTTIEGRYTKAGKKVSIYVSNAYFDGNYGYMSGSNFKASIIYLFGINHLSCIDPVICEYQKSWIESLIAYSTLISGSGRLHGIDFFDQQRELLHNI